VISKNIVGLLLLNVLVLITGYILISLDKLSLAIGDIAILSGVFSVIALITIIIFVKGQSKEPDAQTLYTLVAISLKFLLELIIALLWFFNAKKNSFESVLIFFVLYLALSLFSVGAILKALKNKAL
jgi:hypothetical protein